MTTSDSRPAIHGRRRYQFSLRALLLLTLVTAIVCGVISGWIQRSRELAAYREEVLAKLGFPWLPEWKGKNLVGLSIWLTDAPAPEHLARLKHVPNLRRLTLWFSDVTDAHLEHLKVLPRLEVLYLMNTDVTDAGLEHLEHLTTLRDLDLTGTDITDKGLVHLKGLANLRKLSIDGTQVTEKGARELRQALPRCRIHR